MFDQVEPTSRQDPRSREPGGVGVLADDRIQVKD